MTSPEPMKFWPAHVIRPEMNPGELLLYFEIIFTLQLGRYGSYRYFTDQPNIF